MPRVLRFVQAEGSGFRVRSGHRPVAGGETGMRHHDRPRPRPRIVKSRTTTTRMDAYLMLAERERQRKADKIGVGVGIGVEKEIGMAFGHEKLDVYRAAIEYPGPARPDRGDVHKTRPARVCCLRGTFRICRGGSCHKSPATQGQPTAAAGGSR